MTLKEVLQKMPKKLIDSFCDFCHKLEEISGKDGELIDVENTSLDDVWTLITDLELEKERRKD